MWTDQEKTPRKSCGPCGVRGTPRFYLSVSFCTLLSLFIIFVIVLFIGAEIEGNAIKEADNTDALYSTLEVCASKADHPFGDSLTNDSMATFNTSELAAAADYKIAHCAACGMCSTLIDIDIYNKTKETLTKTATACASRGFLGGEEAVYDCFEEDVEFTPGCNQCWTDAVMCNMRNCVFTCVKSILTFEQNNEQNGGQSKIDEGGVTRPPLNNCLLCDEKMCGPEFHRCAGANRRRAGIISDIGRDEVNQVCGKVDLDWVDHYATGN